MNERIELALGRIAEIPGETCVPEPYREYFRRVAEFLLSVRKETDNYELYRDILPENYGTSYANPDYAVRKLGSPMGELLSAVYAELRGIIPAVFEDDDEGICVLYELFLEIYGDFQDDELPEYEGVKSIFRSYLEDYMPDFIADRIRRQVDPEMDFCREIIKNADFLSTDYLYAFGEYITDDVIACAAYQNSLPETKIKSMADTFTEGYRIGFEHARKSLKNKKTVQIVYSLGFERMMRYAIENFEKMGLSVTIVRAPYRLVTKTANRKNGYTGAIPNMQFDYDHQEDLGLIMDDEYVTRRLRALREGYEEVRELAYGHAGPAVLETFGEEPFMPEDCPARITLSPSQKEKSVRMRNESTQITQRYIKQDERSFTIISFPVPSIGKDFREIFDEVIRINTLDNAKYERIQQCLIDALDKGYAARVKGCGANVTDLIVHFHPLEDAGTQTAFENCVADVNIPVGEVFTSPQLEGTDGTLFVSRVFLNGYEFKNLSITLKDGMITDYSCGNFDDPEKGREYIESKILFHHKTLPIGEFAIGTNTYAYVMGRKYGVEGRLPILIAEKTGPHFAMGDTCYSWEEDNPVYNPDGKEIIARENSVSCLRRTDPGKAYFGCHTDITIPYEELESIKVLLPGGNEIPLIENGRFVLPGTEELNIPLDNFSKV